jgi:hypothetical protein
MLTATDTAPESAAAVDKVEAVPGRALHSYTCQRNLSRFCHSKYTLNTPYTPLTTP